METSLWSNSKTEQLFVSSLSFDEHYRISTVCAAPVCLKYLVLFCTTVRSIYANENQTNVENTHMSDMQTLQGT